MIIICECKSYEFDIPDSELPKKNTLVQCSLCGKEWYQDFKNNKIISDKKQINPSKIKKKTIQNQSHQSQLGKAQKVPNIARRLCRRPAEVGKKMDAKSMQQGIQKQMRRR